ETFSADIIDLKPGDYVVHCEHGVALYLGLREISGGENKGDYMVLEYTAGAKLYVPLTSMNLVQRFRGAGESKPALDRMGGVTWTRTKSRIKAKMRDMADELLKLYATRKMTEGFIYSPDSNWQREFEDAFEFTPTRDQLTAMAEIKRDMESPQPMDRLLCGDVGYGKTEVVMRATFKALGDGKQVVILAPTTVLVFQHFETFKRRFQPFPVRVEMFSRFRTPKELKAAVADLAEGRIDVAIGTHRLFSGDVQFKDLGLVIVDEEQRFGVKHKERLTHPSNTTYVIAWLARHVGDRDSPEGSPRHPHRGGAVPTRTHPPGAGTGVGTRRAGLLPAQSRGLHLDARPLHTGNGARGAHRRRTRPDGRGRIGEDHAGVHAPRVRHPGLYDNHRKWSGDSPRQHHDHRECRALWPLRTLSVARARRPVEPAPLCLPAGPARYRAHRNRSQ